MGLLSERRAWTGRADPANIDSHGSDLKDKRGEERQQTQDPSQTEALMKRRAWVCGRQSGLQGVSGHALAAMHHSS
jgi:hypothetical protein